MKMFKGFTKNWKCRDFQFEMGKEYKEDRAELCSSGFHACEYPLDVFSYYGPATSKFAEVDLNNISEERGDDSKRVGKKIKILAEINLQKLIKASVKFIFEKVDWENSKEFNTGDYSVATNIGYQSVSTNTGNQSVSINTGNRSVATNTGDYSVATNIGDYSVATNTGNQSVATNTGDYSVATNIGYQSVSTNTGNQSVSTNTGNQSVSTNTGNQSVSTNTGNQSIAAVEGKQSIAFASGYKSKARGELGCWIVLAEWDETFENIIRVKTHKVDGKKIKPNVFYMLENGKFIESDE